LLAAPAGRTAASLLVYAVGVLFGEHGAAQITTPDRFARWRRAFLRHRRITLALGALTPVPYVTLCLLGGVFRVALWELLVFAVCARICRIGATGYILLLFQGLA
jgi:membrane protein YqaA with SNARE-associated domain